MREIGTFFAGAILALSLTLPGAAHAAKIFLSPNATSLELTTAPGGTPLSRSSIAGKPYRFGSV